MVENLSHLNISARTQNVKNSPFGFFTLVAQILILQCKKPAEHFSHH